MTILFFTSLRINKKAIILSYTFGFFWLSKDRETDVYKICFCFLNEHELIPKTEFKTIEEAKAIRENLVEKFNQFAVDKDWKASSWDYILNFLPFGKIRR